MGSLLTTPPHRGAALRLFCFPHAGAGASAYRAWVQALAEDGIAVCPVQLPGRENRLGEQPHREIEPLIGELVAGIASEFDRPYALFGHSMGALVAFELANAVRDRGGLLPVHLFVSGRIAPQLTDTRAKLHALTDSELLARLADLGGIPRELLADEELMAFQLPLLRVDLAVNENYRYLRRPPLPTPITAFCGRRDPKVTETETRAWAAQTVGGFAAHALPGGHFFVQESTRSLLRQIALDVSLSTAPP